LTWAGIVVAGILCVAVIAASLFDWNLLRPALARKITAVTGRSARIAGDLKVHVWSWHPRAEINGLEIDNPAWADRHVMFGAKRLTVSVSVWHLLFGEIVLPQLDVLEPVINLQRDREGRASWELGTSSGVPNHNTKPAKLPTIQRLTIEGGALHVVDQIRKLTFSGSLVAGEQQGKDDASAFKIRCSGSLNEKPFKLDANGGPLLNLEPTKPYSFAAHLTASDINLETHVTVRKPFDLGAIDMQFVVSGDDLADAYYLTGLALPNTPKYRLGATVHVDGTTYKVDDVKGTLGTSDLEGTIEILTAQKTPKLIAKLSSATLDIADLAPTLGHRRPQPQALSAAAARKASAAQPAADSGPQTGAGAAGGMLLPDADLQVKRVRGMDADVSYRALSVKAPKLPLREVNLHVVLDGGLLTIDPLSFGLDQGKFAGRVQIDARKSTPVTDVDMRIEGVKLGEFKSAAMKEPPLEGTLLGRLKLHGEGTSVHKFAADSTGAMSVVIPSGEISDAIAELTGINVLKGLGLLLTKAQQKTEIRCGIMDFKDQNGLLGTTTVYIDTSNVLITGRGNINLADEDIKLALQGDPKHVRLIRLRSPIAVGGTLLHPSVGLQAGKLAEQAGAAAALGVLLTPAAAALAFIDPGLAKDKDCSTVMAQADAGVQGEAKVAPPSSRLAPRMPDHAQARAQPPATVPPLP
jgi:uncharacterized protein involved in outer membrane biogenesis